MFKRVMVLLGVIIKFAPTGGHPHAAKKYLKGLYLTLDGIEDLGFWDSTTSQDSSLQAHPLFELLRFQAWPAEGSHEGAMITSWEENTTAENYIFLGTSVALVLIAGCMSGLTLGLCSIDKKQLEVLKRSGTALEKTWAVKVEPIIQNSHYLLVTLLLCNAVAMEALPLFLDRLANPIMAIIVSVTAVLFFGEIIPQSICTRYGLAIGAHLSLFVRILMVICSPIAWPLGKLLDRMLGADHHSMFRRTQLKAFVDMHAEDRGLGGGLSKTEIKIISGAMDLTTKTAYYSMTPLKKVFMLSTEDKLDEPTLRAIIQSGHSRIPVHGGGIRNEILGIVLVKELLQYKMSQQVPVRLLKMRSLPRLSAATPMYDMLKLFQTGRSHMAVLTQPYESEIAQLNLRTMQRSGGGARQNSPPTTPPPSSDISQRGSYLAPNSLDRSSSKSLMSPATSGKAAPQLARVAEILNGDDWSPSAAGAPDRPPKSRRCSNSEFHPIPAGLLEPGAAIGIITIEDVIEELICSEIIDETDCYVDNEQVVRVNPVELAKSLPERVKALLAGGVDINTVRRAVGASTTPVQGPSRDESYLQPLLSSSK